MNCPFDMNKISNGTDFEIEVTDYLLELGFQAKRTGRNDFGVDIIALKVVNNKEYTFNIQCKYYNKALAFSPIQEVFSGTRYHDNNGIPVVITNNTFTASARTYASSLGVEVIGDFEWRILNNIIAGTRKTARNTGTLLKLIASLKTNRPELFKDTQSKDTVKKSEETEKDKLIAENLTKCAWIEEKLKYEEECYQKAIEARRDGIELYKSMILNSGYA